MHFSGPLPRLPRLFLLGAVEIGLLPLRLAAKLIGGLLLVVALVGLPAWLIQLAIALLGGGSGGGPLPPWEMVLVLAAAVPGAWLAFRAAAVRGPLSSRGRAEPDTAAPVDDDPATSEDEPDRRNQEPRSERSPAGELDERHAWAYETLQLDRTASLADVKASYRRLAQLYHPDHNPGFTEQAAGRFATITAAYEVLFDALTASELSE